MANAYDWMGQTYDKSLVSTGLDPNKPGAGLNDWWNNMASNPIRDQVSQQWQDAISQTQLLGAPQNSAAAGQDPLASQPKPTGPQSAYPAGGLDKPDYSQTVDAQGSQYLGSLPVDMSQIYTDLLNYGNWTDPTQAQNRQTYLDNTLPLLQYIQNQQQYGQDFSEAQRRFNEQFGYQQGLDQWNQQFSQQQLDLTKWQAEQASGQWQQQFADQQQQNQFNQELANRQFSLDENYRNAQIDEMAKRYGLDRQTVEANIRNQEAMRANEANRLALDTQLGTGRLTLDQMLGQANVTNLQQLRDLDKQRLAQELLLAREQMANAQRLAAIQTTGRQQAPVATFVSNWQ